jgi:hypothetical protein
MPYGSATLIATKNEKGKCIRVQGRVADADTDLDPYLIRIQSGQLIRIRIRYTDPDPEGQK